jgi:hypothetical protein
MRWLLKWWHRRQRDIDIQMLWPSFKNQAADMTRARTAFECHTSRDRAWLCLSDEEYYKIIDNLK